MGCYADLQEKADIALHKTLEELYIRYPDMAPKLKLHYHYWESYRESYCSIVYEAWGDGGARQYAYPKCLYEMSINWKNPTYINYK